MAPSVKITSTNRIRELLQNTNTKGVKVGFLNAKEAQIAAKNEFGGVYPITEEYRERAWRVGRSYVKRLYPDLFREWMEYWDKKQTMNIIPRPFMHTTVKEHGNEWIEMFPRILKRNSYDLDKSLESLAKKVVADIQRMIENNEFPKNPFIPATVKKGRDHPLVDTGEMRRSVEYALVKK